jgi:methionine sulfoxide reductase catalytic subunit
MTLIKVLSDWFIPEHKATSESVFFNRRKMLKGLGLGTIGATSLLASCSSKEEKQAEVKQGLNKAKLKNLIANKNPEFTLDRELTEEAIAATYNNFYEFSSGKEVWRFVDKFQTNPWTIEVSGLVAKPKTFAIEDLIAKMPLEERLYRHRCVETWAMAVPWIGFPLKELLRQVEPTSKAKFVKMTTFQNVKQAPNQTLAAPWPYTEGLTLAEANNDLAILAVGIYGHELPKQHGAPIRLVVPWKYGFKSIKSIVKIELTETQPATFWNTLDSFEYDFLANVNPEIPHPRWSQATERMLGSSDRRKTKLYNGYQDQVASLYTTSPL